MLDRIKSWLKSEEEKTPNYDYTSIVRKALAERDASNLNNDSHCYFRYSAEVRLPVYTEKARQFWYDLMRPLKVFKLRGFNTKWVVAQVSSDAVILQEIVCVRVLR